ncbi:hypothetical protein GLYMA_09G087650v4 [Glycine max]|nr:hypothetical protein GLYMA_09G087650v4 [Glycine max]KAH1042158.1 hypothetical protein GYH30_024462 [Glycine max]
MAFVVSLFFFSSFWLLHAQTEHIQLDSLASIPFVIFCGFKI